MPAWSYSNKDFAGVYERYVGKASAEIQTSYWAAQASAQSDRLGLWQDPDPGATVGMAQREDCYTAISRFT